MHLRTFSRRASLNSNRKMRLRKSPFTPEHCKSETLMEGLHYSLYRTIERERRDIKWNDDKRNRARRDCNAVRCRLRLTASHLMQFILYPFCMKMRSMRLRYLHARRDQFAFSLLPLLFLVLFIEAAIDLFNSEWRLIWIFWARTKGFIGLSSVTVRRG
jgi:hypothetical protein